MSDTTPGRDAGDNHAHDKVRPVRSEPSHESACDDDSEIRAAKSFQLNVFAARMFTSGSRSRANSQTQTALMAAATSAMTIMMVPRGSDPPT